MLEDLCSYVESYSQYLVDCQMTIAKMDQQVKDYRTMAASLREDYTSMVSKRPVVVVQRTKEQKTGVFGVTLAEVFSRENSFHIGLPSFLKPIFSYIFNNCLRLEGIFRLSPNKEELKAFKVSINQGNMPDYGTVNDPHVVSGLLGLWLREMPEPLCTFEYYDRFISLRTITDEKALAAGLKSVVNSLPPSNKTVLQHLMHLLANVAIYAGVNKMTPSNLAIVFGPTILYSKVPDPLTFESVNKITEHMIVYYQEIFGEPTSSDKYRRTTLSPAPIGSTPPASTASPTQTPPQAPITAAASPSTDKVAPPANTAMQAQAAAVAAAMKQGGLLRRATSGVYNKPLVAPPLPPSSLSGNLSPSASFTAPPSLSASAAAMLSDVSTVRSSPSDPTVPSPKRPNPRYMSMYGKLSMLPPPPTPEEQPQKIAVQPVEQTPVAAVEETPQQEIEEEVHEEAAAEEVVYEEAAEDENGEYVEYIEEVVYEEYEEPVEGEQTHEQYYEEGEPTSEQQDIEYSETYDQQPDEENHEQYQEIYEEQSYEQKGVDEQGEGGVEQEDLTQENYEQQEAYEQQEVYEQQEEAYEQQEETYEQQEEVYEQHDEQQEVYQQQDEAYEQSNNQEQEYHEQGDYEEQHYEQPVSEVHEEPQYVEEPQSKISTPPPKRAPPVKPPPGPPPAAGKSVSIPDIPPFSPKSSLPPRLQNRPLPVPVKKSISDSSPAHSPPATPPIANRPQFGGERRVQSVLATSAFANQVAASLKKQVQDKPLD
eukprot:TRINITY_DN4104_c0_g1_i2.p1 TRINITY_DN4104_c0_g1~~TRINITY_DN4104_c0_g1_i2.p1  ORF type:complete len:763 (+),score=191.26 TRINITY_DN4104_c0_g1_i2:284-2572(+)